MGPAIAIILFLGLAIPIIIMIVHSFKEHMSDCKAGDNANDEVERHIKYIKSAGTTRSTVHAFLGEPEAYNNQIELSSTERMFLSKGYSFEYFRIFPKCQAPYQFTVYHVVVMYDNSGNVVTVNDTKSSHQTSY